MSTLNPLHPTQTQPTFLEEIELSPEQLHRFFNEKSGTVGGRYCGLAPIGQGGQVIKKITISDRAFIAPSRTQKCSPTTCPKGHAASASRHAEELHHVLTRHFEAGGGLLFGTMTVKSEFHNAPRGFSNSALAIRTLPEYEEIKKMPSSAAEKRHLIEALQAEYSREIEANTWETGWTLASQLQAVRDGLTRAFVGSVWTREAAALGVLGRASSIEVVLYPHPKLVWKRVRANIHVHYLLFTESVVKENEQRVEALRRSLHSRWNRVATKHGLTSRLKHQHLVTVTPSSQAATRLSSYIPKGSLSEKPSVGSGEKQGRSLFAPLIDAAKAHAQGQPLPTGAVALWKNLEALFSGIHLYRLTPSLLQRYGVKELRAEKKASRKALTVEPLVLLEPELWQEAKKTSPELLTLLQEAARTNEPAELLSELLSSLNIPHLKLAP